MASMTRFNPAISWKRLGCLVVMLPAVVIISIAFADFASAQDAPSPQPNPRPISQIHGLDLRMDFLADNPQVSISDPSSVLQQVWNALQPSGYDVLRISLDVRDANAATERAFSLCSWAKDNNVKLILVLTGADRGQPLSKDYPKIAAEFVKTLIVRFRTGGDQALAAYAQIRAFQIENELNHPGKHGGMPSADLKNLALNAAKLLHQTQADALKETGLQAAPLMASVSFDFPLIQAGGIAGVALSDSIFAKAYKDLQSFLSALAASPDIDLLAVDWFAGSISAGTVDQFPQLLEKLMAGAPGKRVVFSSGFSSAGHTPEQQQSFAAGFLQLANFCMNRGSECRFAGNIFHEAVNAPGAVVDPQSPAAAADWQTWDWPSKAKELTAVWTNKKQSSDDLTRWLAAIENSMGLVSLQMASDQPTPPTQTTATAPAGDAAGGLPSGVVNGQQQPVANATTTSVPAQTACTPQPDPTQALVPTQAPSANCQSSASALKTVVVSVIGKMMSGLADQVVQRMAPKAQPSNVAPGTVYPPVDPALNTSIAPATGIPPQAYGSNPPTNSYQPPAVQPGSQAANTLVAPGDGSGTNPVVGAPVSADSSQSSTPGGNTVSQTQPPTTTQQQPVSAGTGTANGTNNSVVIVRPGSSFPQAGNAANRTPTSTPRTNSTVPQLPPVDRRPQPSGIPNSGVRTGAAFPQNANAASPTPAASANSTAPPLPPVDRRPQPAGIPNSGVRTGAAFPQNANAASPTPATSANVTVSSLPPVDRRPQPAVQPNSNQVLTGNSSTVLNGVDLSVATSRLNMTPAQPRAGQTVTFTVDVTNLGMRPPQGASATFVLFAGGREFRRSPAIPFTIGGRNAISPVRWTAVLPAEAGSMSVKIIVNDVGDTNLANNSMTFQFVAFKR